MKNLKYYMLGAILASAGAALTSCQDDFDAPGLERPVSSWLENPAYELRTIADVKEEFWSDDTNYYKEIGETADGKHIIVKGTVVSSDAAGNVYKSLVIQDKTAALAMSINRNSMNVKYRRGQELVIDLTGMTIGKYAGLQQLGEGEDSPQYGAQTTFMSYEKFELHSQMNGLPDLAAVDTITVNSFSELNGGGPATLRKWQSQLVRFNNCEFEEGGTETFAAYQVTTSRTLKLSDGNTLNVRTSGYANFYSTVMPAGKGDVVGLLGYFNNAWQLTLIDVAGCMNFGNPTIGPGAQDNPYTVPQAISVISNGGIINSVWTQGYIVGAVAPGVTAVSKQEDLQWGKDVELPTTLAIGATPDTKAWDEVLIVELPQGSALRKYGNLADHPENAGKKINILGNLSTVMSTYGITGNKGTADEFTIEGVEIPGGDTPSEGDGDGSEDKPYSVDQMIALGSPGTSAWVKGYIVGWVEGAKIQEGAHFTVPATSASNLLIASSASETDPTKCVPVQLVAQTELRTALNLMDNPGNLGKEVSIQGSLEKYFGQPGLKSPTAYKLGEGGGTPDTPPAGAVSSLNETFNGLSALPSDWTQAQIKGDKKWYITSYQDVYYAAMTGYKGTAPFDSWLISPAIDMAKVTDKKLTFDSQVNGYGSTTSHFEVYILDGADPATAGKTKLNPTLPEAPASGYSGWQTSGPIDLSAQTGTIYVAFRYEATQDANFATWCVTNVKLNADGGGSTGGGDEPPSTDSTTADFSAFGSTATSYGTYTASNGWVATWAQILSGSASPDNKATFAVFGTEKDFAVCLNGRVGKQGVLTSPSLAGGIGTLTFDYCQPYTDTKCKLTINIKQNGTTVASDVLENNGMTKLQKYTYSHAFNVKGDFTLEIVNDCPSATDSANKDRVAIWNMSWTH